MRKKRKGSVILMVLMVSTVMILLSATISSALVFTTTGTTREKIKSDYLYAAEGGLELGIQKYKEHGKVGFPSDGYKPSHLVSTSSGIDSVIVTFEVVNSIEKIVSTVYTSQGPVTRISVPVIEGIVRSSADVLKNAIYSSAGISIDTSASADFAFTDITHNGNSTIDIPKNPVNGNVTGTNTQKPEFYPEIVTKIEPEIEVNVRDGFDGLWNIANDMSLNVTTVVEDSIGKLPNGVGRMLLNRQNLELTNLESNVTTVDDYRLIVVDTPKLIINLPPGAINLTKTILICSGQIDLVYTPRHEGDKSTINMNNSTIYGNQVNIKGNAVFTINYAPANGQNALLIDKQLEKIDMLLNKYLKNWGANSNGGSSSGSDIKIEDIEYEEF